jgi:thioredoxin 1
MHEDLLIATMEDWKSRVLKSELPVVVEYYTPTCPYCSRLTPIFRKLSEVYGDRMRFAMVDSSVSTDIAEGYGVMGVPTIKFFCDGRPIHEIVGFKPEEELKQEIEKILETHKRRISQSSPLYA